MPKYYTGKGDDGTTIFFGCKERFLKSGVRAEALGTLDELNSLVGLCRAKMVDDKGSAKLLFSVQEALFVAQAEVAGSEKKLQGKHVRALEKAIEKIAVKLPEIKSFLIPGSSEMSALYDVVRTVARRAERSVVGVKESGEVAVGKQLLAYLNRLSSLFYVLARLEAEKHGINERRPSY